MHPLIILTIGLVTVISMIVLFRIHAFLALITAAMVVSLLGPGDWGLKITRVATAFGETAGGIGIVIALASIIGKAMMDSGAADRVVRMFLTLLGEKRSALALMGSGFTLSIPVFFDTAFYLLVPLARSLYRTTGRHYLKYLIAITAGGAITHTLLPPTPGPLFIASQLGVDLGMMMLVGAVVALPAALAGLLFGAWCDRRKPIAMRPYSSQTEETGPIDATLLPPLWLALLPIALPIALITANSVVKVVATSAVRAQPTIVEGTAAEPFLVDGHLQVIVPGQGGAPMHRVLSDREWTDVLLAVSDQGIGSIEAFQVTNLIGNPNFSLLLSAVLALAAYWRQRQPTRQEMASSIETALMSGGVIILITAAGGAFGAMLKTARLGDVIEGMVRTDGGQMSGLLFLLLSFGVASLIKFANGSSTAAMIITSGMISSMLPADGVGIHAVYLALAIGSGSLVGSWMNDSGFWIYCQMGVLTEVEALRSWTPLLALLGVTSMAITVLLALLMPMAGG